MPINLLPIKKNSKPLKEENSCYQGTANKLKKIRKTYHLWCKEQRANCSFSLARLHSHLATATQHEQIIAWRSHTATPLALTTLAPLYFYIGLVFVWSHCSILLSRLIQLGNSNKRHSFFSQYNWLNHHVVTNVLFSLLHHSTPITTVLTHLMKLPCLLVLENSHSQISVRNVFCGQYFGPNFYYSNLSSFPS